MYSQNLDWSKLDSILQEVAASDYKNDGFLRFTDYYRLVNAKCKIFEKKQLIFPIDLSKNLHLALLTR